MKKLLTIAVIILLLTNATPIFAATEAAIIAEETEGVETLQILDYAWRIAALVGFTFTTYVGYAARGFLKKLTPERTIQIVSAAILRLGRDPKQLTSILEAAVQVPLIRDKLEEGKVFAKTRLNQIDEKVLDYETRIKSGLLDPEEADRHREFIARLLTEKIGLQKYAQNTDK